MTKMDYKKMPNKIFEFDDKKHVYTLDGKNMTGVTTILGMIAKPALISWAANEACKRIGELWEADKPYSKELIDSILSEGKSAHRKKKEAAGDVGTKAHEQIEGFIKTGNWNATDDEQVNELVTKFIVWSQVNKVKFLESEKRLFSEKYWYAGTVDFVCEIDGQVWIGDLKTSSGIYPEYFFQTAGYQIALQEMGHYPEIVGHIIVRCGKDGSFEEKRSISTEDNKQAFLSALTLYRVIEKLKGTV